MLERECGLTREASVADIAAGTGLLTEIFLERGYAVDAVEPNDAMRAVCAALISQWPRLRCLTGTAEATGLADQSKDLLTVAQAMHWFDLERTRKEFARVLKPGGWCAVIYNNRREGGDAFHEGYERVLREFGREYLAVQSRHMSAEKLAEFFLPSVAKEFVFPNEQQLTFEALLGRICSSSYMPQPGDARFAELNGVVKKLHHENAIDGVVALRYDCTVTYGHLHSLR